MVHLCTPGEYVAARRAGRVEPPSLRTEGFVHCSTLEQVHLPANRLFRGREDLVLLRLDPDGLRAPVRFEPGVAGDPSAMRFPHVYGPLPWSAVVGVHAYPPGPDGRFGSPDLEAECVDLVDEGGTPTGVATRARVRAQNLRHAATAVVVRDADGRVLVHRRAADKDVYPGMFDFCLGGIVQAGEDPAVAAAREVAEEAGIRDVRLTPVLTGSYADDVTSYVAFAYEARHTGPVTPQTKEIAWMGWSTVGEILARLDDPPQDVVPDSPAVLGDWLRRLPRTT